MYSERLGHSGVVVCHVHWQKPQQLAYGCQNCEALCPHSLDRARLAGLIVTKHSVLFLSLRKFRPLLRPLRIDCKYLQELAGACGHCLRKQDAA